ncbi:hypothetical protein ACQEV4_38005 [Streptomyces shenzhenensis]
MARLFRLAAPAGRAVVFTGATRNSLVVPTGEPTANEPAAL